MSTGTHRSACHVRFVAKPGLSDPGRVCGETHAGTGSQLYGHHRGDLGLQPGNFWGNGSEPCACTPDPHCPRARWGRLGREKCALQTAVWGVGSGVMFGAACGLPPPSSPGGASCRQHRPPTHWALCSSPNSGSFPRPPACCGPAWTLRCVLRAPPGHRASGTRIPSFLRALGSWRPPASLCAPPLLCRTMEIKQPWKSQRHPSPGHAKSESLKLSAGRGKTGPRTPVRGSRGDPGSPPRFFPPCRAGGREGPWPRDPPSWGRMGPVPHL